MPLLELFLRKKEDDIRISLQELSQQSFNEDEVILELESMVEDISRTRQAIPQVIELQSLSELNRKAKERGLRWLTLHYEGSLYQNNVLSNFNYSPNSSPPDDDSTYV